MLRFMFTARHARGEQWLLRNEFQNRKNDNDAQENDIIDITDITE